MVEAVKQHPLDALVFPTLFKCRWLAELAVMVITVFGVLGGNSSSSYVQSSTKRTEMEHVAPTAPRFGCLGGGPFLIESST